MLHPVAAAKLARPEGLFDDTSLPKRFFVDDGDTSSVDSVVALMSVPGDLRALDVHRPYGPLVLLSAFVQGAPSLANALFNLDLTKAFNLIGILCPTISCYYS